jgi:phage terminase large subunit
MVNVGILEYIGDERITQTLVDRIYARGHKITFLDDISSLNSEAFEAVLMHPGVENQIKAIEFYRSHPEKRIAIITLGEPTSPREYETVKADANEIPIFYYTNYSKIINFIEGKPTPIEDI